MDAEMNSDFTGFRAGYSDTEAFLQGLEASDHRPRSVGVVLHVVGSTCSMVPCGRGK